jgi:hypothetical protein
MTFTLSSPDAIHDDIEIQQDLDAKAEKLLNISRLP